MPDPDLISVHAERIRSSDILGRSEQLHRLFEYLVACSRTGTVSKESVIAVEVFGRGQNFDVSQDAAVRVYIHKLRRKFEKFYAECPHPGDSRLVIPKGEYRLILEQCAPLTPPSELVPATVPRDRNPWKVAALVAVAGLLLTCTAAWFSWRHATGGDFRAVRDSAVWAQLLSDRRPITVVLGDYYIFAETDELRQPKRLVREFAINSSRDLDRYLLDNPDQSSHYVDAQLAYLPTSSAYVMADIMPLLASTHRTVRVTMMSALDAQTLKSTDVVYVGYLSGLGILYDASFSGSRFSIGDSYDEILDSNTHTHYVSQAPDRLMRPVLDATSDGSPVYRQYSLIAGFEGPSGNRVLIIAGTRDIGLMQAGETLVTPATVRQLSDRLPAAAPFEALYEVTGINSTNIASRLLITGARKPANVWDRTAVGTNRLSSTEGTPGEDR